MTEHLVRGLAAIVLLGVTAQWLAAALRLPSILLLLVFGFVAGPLTGVLNPNEIFGDLVNPIISLSVALILYEGGLSLRIHELKKIGGVVRNLVSVGALIMWAVGTLAGIYFLGLYWKLALLFGAILVVTGPTVIMPLLRLVRPEGEVGPVLRWEGIVIDSVGAVLAVLTFEAIHHNHGGMESVLGFLYSFLVGGGIGLATGCLLYFLLKHFLIPDYLQNAVSLMMVFGAFSGSNMIIGESGVVAVTVMGIFLANQQSFAVKHIVEFKENLQVLLISGLFIILSASLNLDQVLNAVMPSSGSQVDIVKTLEGMEIHVENLSTGLITQLTEASEHVNLITLSLFMVALIIVGRPLSVLASTIGSSLSWKERIFLSFMAPRGIVAAAVASVFAIRLASESLANLRTINPVKDPELFTETFLLATQAPSLVPLTFIVIIATVSFYGLGAPLVARWLGVSQPNPQGFLIVGAHPLARAIGHALKEEKIKVLLADTNWGNWHDARMEGLETYYGNVLNEYSLEHLDLEGIGRLLSLTNNDEVNSLSALHFVEIFGRAKVFQLPPSDQGEGLRDRPGHLRGRYLFGKAKDYRTLMNKWDKGARIKKTNLSDEFDWLSYVKLYGEGATPLFAVLENGKVEVITQQKEDLPATTKSLISLVDESVVAMQDSKTEKATEEERSETETVD